jgi:hypothetical protein
MGRRRSGGRPGLSNLRYAPGYDQYIIEVIPPGWIVNTGACADDGVSQRQRCSRICRPDYLGVSAPGYWPSYRYAYAWTYPNYVYYYGYGGGPYVGPTAEFTRRGETRPEGCRRQVDRAKPTVAKDNGALTPHAAKPAKGPVPIGVATTTVARRRKDNPRRPA